MYSRAGARAHTNAFYTVETLGAETITSSPTCEKSRIEFPII